MHKQGDVVVYVEAGVESNALVLSSSERADAFPGQAVDSKNPPSVVEHVNLVLVPDKTDGVPNLTPVAHGLFLRTVFGVRPSVSGAAAGWKELVEGADQITALQKHLDVANELITKQVGEISDLTEKLAATTEGKDEAFQAISDAGAVKPSAADLDAVAAEQVAKQATAPVAVPPCACKEPVPVPSGGPTAACGKCGGEIPPPVADDAPTELQQEPIEEHAQ